MLSRPVWRSVSLCLSTPKLGDDDDHDHGGNDDDDDEGGLDDDGGDGDYDDGGEGGGDDDVDGNGGGCHDGGDYGEAGHDGCTCGYVEAYHPPASKLCTPDSLIPL